MEKIEQASEYYAHNYFDMHETNNYKALKEGFIAGAKWQQEQDNKLYNEESECVNMYLDDLKIQRKSENDKEYSTVGRIKLLESRYLKQMSDVESHYLNKQERSYSEEEVKVKLYECLGHFAQKHNIIINSSEIDQWFEQFKNK